MIRGFLYFIVIANLGVFLWHQTQYKSDKSPASGKIPVLINNERIQVVEPFYAAKDVDVSVPSLQTNKNEKKQRLKDNLGEDNIEVAEKNIETAVNESGNTVEQPLLQPIELQTPEEQSAEELYPVENEVPQEIEQQDLPQAPCYQINLLSESEVAIWETELTKMGHMFKTEGELVSVPAGYLVLIEPQKDLPAAHQKMRKAKSMGLDTFVINRGKWSRGVSLGVFSTKNNALKTQKRVLLKMPDEKIMVEPRFNEKTLFKIQIKWPDPENELNLWSDPSEFANKTINMQKITKKSCKEIEF